MGFLNRLKTLVGAHGASTRLHSIQDRFPNEGELRLCRDTLRVQFDVVAEQDVEVVGHLVQLRVGLLDRDPPEERVAFEAREDAQYTLAAGGTRRVELHVPLDLPALLRGCGVDPETAVQNDRIRWAVCATADVRGTPIDASARQDLPLMGVDEEWMTGDHWATAPTPPSHPLHLWARDGDAERDTAIERIALTRDPAAETMTWVMHPADGRGTVTMTLRDPSDLHCSRNDTGVKVVWTGPNVTLEVGCRYEGWVIVTYRACGRIRGWMQGTLHTVDEVGGLSGTFDLALPA